jgi:hypothetical protein
MRLTILSSCPKCLEQVEAEYKAYPSKKAATLSSSEVIIELDDILSGKFLCSNCNKEIDAIEVITKEITSKWIG